MPSTVDKDNVTSSASTALCGIAAIVTHTVSIWSLSVMVALVGREKVAATVRAKNYSECENLYKVVIGKLLL